MLVLFSLPTCCSGSVFVFLGQDFFSLFLLLTDAILLPVTGLKELLHNIQKRQTIEIA